MWEGVLFLKLTNKILFAEKSLKKFKKIQKNSKKFKKNSKKLKTKKKIYHQKIQIKSF
jgi:hypothetical protein